MPPSLKAFMNLMFVKPHQIIKFSKISFQIRNSTLHCTFWQLTFVALKLLNCLMHQHFVSIVVSDGIQFHLNARKYTFALSEKWMKISVVFVDFDESKLPQILTNCQIYQKFILN